MAERIYYWLKLKKDFFRQKEIKRLRGIAGGEVYVIIYLKMLLLSLDNDGYILYEKYYDTFAEELADQIDEKADNVKIVIAFLLSVGLLVEVNESSFMLTKCSEMTGRETSAAIRKRKSREKKKVLQAENSETALLEQSEQNNQGNISQNVTMSHDSHAMSQEGHIEIEKEKEKEIDFKKENIKEKNLKKSEINEMFEKLWDEYPNQKGKVKAKNYFVAALKQGTTFDQILNGIRAYTKFIRENNIDGQFIKQCDNYFQEACWNNNYSAKPITTNAKPTATAKKPSYDLDAVKNYAVPFEVSDTFEKKG